MGVVRAPVSAPPRFAGVRNSSQVSTQTAFRNVKAKSDLFPPQRRFMSLWRAGIEFSHKGTLARVMGANERFKRLVKTFFVAWTDLIHWRASLRFVSIYSSNIIRAKCQVEYFQAWVEVVEYREIQRL